MKKTFVLLMMFAVLFSFATETQAQNNYKDIPSSAASPGVYYLGRCSYEEPNPDYALGLDADATLQLFSRMPRSKMRKFVGSQVVGVRIAVLDEITVKAFLKQEINTEIFNSKEAVLHPGWNEVYFDEPYDIAEKSVCFGYEQEVKSSGSELPQYVATYATDGQKETAESDGFYWQVNNKSPESFAKKFGNIMVQLIVSNPPTFTRDLGNLSYLVMPNVKDPDGTSTFKVALQNIGSNPIENYTVAYQINDGAANEIEVTGALAEQSTRLLTISGIQAEKGDKLNVKLMKLNGVDKSAEPGLDAIFDMAEKSFPRKVLLEHFTTEKCGNCPGRDKMMHKVLDGYYKEDFVWAAHHVGFYDDFLTLPESEDLLFMYGEDGTFCPAMSLNRVSLFEDMKYPVVSVPQDEEFFEMMLIMALETPAPLGITVKADYNKDTKEIDVNVSGEIEPNDVNAEDCILNVWVLEDNIKAEKQAGAPKDEEFHHNNVVRYMHEGAYGVQLNVGEDDKYSQNVSIPFNEEWNMDNVRVIAFVSRPIDDPEGNVRVYNSDEVSLSQHQGIEQITSESEVKFRVADHQVLAQGFSSNEIVVRTLDGVTVPNCNLLPGIYVVKAGNSPVQKVVVK